MNRLLNKMLVVSVAVFLGALIMSRGDVSDGDRQPEILVRSEMVSDPWRWLELDTPPDAPVMVVFFTTECPWCRASVPFWNRLRDDLNRRYPTAWTVAVTLSDSLDTVNYSSEVGLSLRIHYPNDKMAMIQHWKVGLVPYTILVHPDGSVIGAWQGVVDDRRYEDIVSALR